MSNRFSFCPVCGGKLQQQSLQSYTHDVCTQCGRINFENPIVGVAAIIMDEQGRVLMVKRSADSSYPGLWCIPCGYVEYHEDIRQAIVREVKEETNLDISCGEVFAVHSNFHNPKQHTVGIWFNCLVSGGTPIAGDDAAAIEWFYPDNPPPLAFPTDYLVLKKILAESSCKNK